MADIRCQRCADRHPSRPPTFLGGGDIVNRDGPVLVVVGYTRAGQKFQAPFTSFALRADGRRQRTVRNGEDVTVALPLDPEGPRAAHLDCHGCGLSPDVPLAKLVAVLQAGYSTVLVGGSGEVRGSGVPRPQADSPGATTSSLYRQGEAR